MWQKANRQMDAGTERATTQNRKNLAAHSPLFLSALLRRNRILGRMGRWLDEKTVQGGGGLWFIGAVRIFPSLSALLSDISNALDNPLPLFSPYPPLSTCAATVRPWLRGGQAKHTSFKYYFEVLSLPLPLCSFTVPCLGASPFH